MNSHVRPARPACCVFRFFSGKHLHALCRSGVFTSRIGVARFIDASIYRDTFPTIRIEILFVMIMIFFFYNDLGHKDT